MSKSLAQLRRALERATRQRDHLHRRYANAQGRVLRFQGLVQAAETQQATTQQRTPGRRGKARAWTGDAIAQAEAAWQQSHGRPPRRFDYDNDPTLPHSTTVWRAKQRSTQGAR